MAGLALSTISVALLTQLPVDGHYFWDLFPAFVLGGAGMGFSFVPVTIASLSGVDRADAGVASGLVNTSRQIGGAIGLAAMSTIAASATSGYAHAHSLAVSSAPAAVNGFQISFDVLGGLMPFPFVSDEQALVTPDPDYITSARLTSTRPQVVTLTPSRLQTSAW